MTKNNNVWRMILRMAITILTAVATALGVQSCR